MQWSDFMIFPFSSQEFVLEWLLIAVLVSIGLIILCKFAIFMLRRRRIASFLLIYKSCWVLFFVCYFSLIGFFIYQILNFSDLRNLRNLIISIIILGLAILFWIGPARGILGLKARKLTIRADETKAEKIVSKDGWVIDSWLGEGGVAEVSENEAKKENQPAKTRFGKNL
ncbi:MULTISPECIES: hypothetical protein [Thermoactinomyces]|uniref:Uncharacterized protein n=2 Tax=Thermoactinomyces TaxID=2023 RepID=A0A7W2AHK9_9BACL|nr:MULTISPECIES: hypothetical protein [Thermoactinomyces]MBA4542851.1 hypothetical protein [Thermoactinomyces daqus]